MNVLDTSIANVSIPAIAGDLGVSPNQGTWTITSFAVANAISVPLTGWLTERYGQVRLFLATTALFVLASLLCGLAISMPMLVFFRVVQGAVAGPMIPLSQTLLLSSYPREKAGVALASFSLTILVAPVVGPVLGAVAGPMIPLSQTLLLSSYPREKAGVALASFSLTILVAPVVGPVLGGWITDNY